MSASMHEVPSSPLLRSIHAAFCFCDEARLRGVCTRASGCRSQALPLLFRLFDVLRMPFTKRFFGRVTVTPHTMLACGCHRASVTVSTPWLADFSCQVAKHCPAASSINKTRFFFREAFKRWQDLLNAWDVRSTLMHCGSFPKTPLPVALSQTC